MQSLLTHEDGRDAGVQAAPHPRNGHHRAAANRPRSGFARADDAALQARAVTENGSSAAPAEVSDASAKLQAIDEVLESVLEQAGRDGRVRKRRFAPADRLSDANDDLQLVLEAVAERTSDGKFHGRRSR